jgi:hypothetical protein
MGKPWEKEAAAEADSATRKFVELLNSKCSKIRVNYIGKRNADCEITIDGDLIGYVEVEYAARWKTSDFPYKTIRYPKAKVKYFDYVKPVFMVTFNRDMSNSSIIDSETLKKEGQMEKVGFIRSSTGKPMRYRKGSEEEFWGIDKTKVLFGVEKFEKYILDKLGIK